METEHEALRRIGVQFEIAGTLVDSRRLGNGHINATYAATYETSRGRTRVVHQRVNRAIFHDVPALMSNVGRVTRHLRGRSLTLVPAKDGADFVRDSDGEYWRTFLYIENARTIEIAHSSHDVFEAARTFGEFVRGLADLPAPALHATIPHFHDTERRFAALVAAVDSDALDRAREAKAEIDFATTNERLASALRRVHECGVPQRIVHNDTKINNVMLSTNGGMHRVIDLDTVMPGYSLYDVGDMLRTGAATAAEDERDLRNVGVRPDYFAAIARGFSEGSADQLLPLEREHFVTAAKTIAFETGLRFLTDYLEGDRYFRVHRPGHNLDRARAQFALVRAFAANESTLASW